MLKKYAYYIDYFARDIIVLFVAFTLLDYYWGGEMIISKNIITAFVLSLLFFLVFPNPIIKRLNNAGYPVKSFMGMANIIPEIEIDSTGIDDLIEKMKQSNHFKKATLVTKDHDMLIVFKKQLFWKTNDVYTYTMDGDEEKMIIKAELSKRHYRKDSRQLIDLAAIKGLVAV